MIGADAGGGEGDGLTHLGVAVGGASLDLGLGDAEAVLVQIGVVEPPAIVQQRHEALGAHSFDDLGHRGVHLGRLAAALVEKVGEGGLEAGI